MAADHLRAWQEGKAHTLSSTTNNAPIIGRQQEITQIARYFQADREGRTHVVLVAGEPGIGKTRLLESYSRIAEQEGLIVLRGGTALAEGTPPYLPFLEALSQHIRRAPLEQLREQAATNPQVVSSILPELAQRLGEFPRSFPLPAEQARVRLYEALCTFIENIGAASTLLLVFDDLQWADTASLDLLRHLVRRQVKKPVLILGAYRNTELDQNAVLVNTIEELQQRQLLKIVTTGPLALEDIAALALSRLGSSSTPEVNTLLYAQSEGNPFFAEELLQCWIDTGSLRQEPAGWRIAAPLENTLPPSIAGALHQRFTRISVDIIDALRVAAIIGHSFDITLLAQVLGKESEMIEEFLLEAERVQLIRATTREGYFTFSHDKIRESLDADLSNLHRRSLHSKIAHQLEAHYKYEDKKNAYQLAELAFHFVRSNDKECGIDYALQAAQQALRDFATTEAITHFQSALRLLGPHDQRNSTVLLGLGEALHLAGKEPEAEQAYIQAQALFLQAREYDMAAQAAYGKGMTQWQQHKVQAAQSSFQDALTLFTDKKCAYAVHVLVALSTLYMVYTGQHTEGRATAARALAIAQHLGDPHLEAIAGRTVAGNLLMQADEIQSAVQMEERVLRLTEASNDILEAAQCCQYIATGYTMQARVTEAIQMYRHQVALFESFQYPQPFMLRASYSWLVMLFAFKGEWEQAEDMVRQSQQLVSQLSTPTPNEFLQQIEGFLNLQRDNYQAAERLFQLLQLAQLPVFVIAFLYAGLPALNQANLGLRDAALAAIPEMEKMLARLPANSLPTAPLLICKTLIAAKLGETALALEPYEKLLAFQGMHFWFLVDRVLGVSARLRQDWEVARKHLAAAEATARREDLRPELARTLWEQAELELRRKGQEHYARQLFKEALDLFNSLGMTRSAEQVLLRLQELAKRVDQTQPLKLPVQLTRREIEVLKLVAKGTGNRQIAETLHITEKTVTNHLTHIFNKTNCDNRTAATAFAIHYGLAE